MCLCTADVPPLLPARSGEVLEADFAEDLMIRLRAINWELASREFSSKCVACGCLFFSCLWKPAARWVFKSITEQDTQIRSEELVDAELMHTVLLTVLI